MTLRPGRTAIWLLAGIGATGAAGLVGGWALSGEPRVALVMALLYLLVSALCFPVLVAPSAHLGARWLAARRRAWVLPTSLALAFPAWLFLLTRVEGFDYGHNPLLHPLDWASLLPLAAGAAIVLLGCRASAARRAAG